MQSQHAIKCATASEIENGIGEFLNGVILDVNSVMSRSLKLADSHVGHD